MTGPFDGMIVLDLTRLAACCKWFSVIDRLREKDVLR